MKRNSVTKNNILIKDAASFEYLSSIDTVVLDKTGTITYGKPHVEKIKSFIDEKQLLSYVASLESISDHPLASAIKQKAKGLPLYEVELSENLIGKGLVGKYLIEKYANIPVEVEIASEYRYKKCFYGRKIFANSSLF